MSKEFQGEYYNEKFIVGQGPAVFKFQKKKEQSVTFDKFTAT